MEELTTFALLVGRVTDSILAAPSTLRSPISVRVLGLGTPPTPSKVLWARAYDIGGFVIAADAGAIALDDPRSTGPDPKHLAGAFDVHFVLSAAGYADLAVALPCSHDAVPIAKSYALAPQPFAIRGRVTIGNAAFGGLSVSITAATPPIPLPPAVLTASDGTYSFASVGAAQSITLSAAGGSQTVVSTYPDPILTVNFSL